MKLLYTPFSIASGIIGARAGNKAFSALWSRISKSPVPSPKAPEANLTGVAISAALEGATLAASTAIVTNLTARLFHYLFGIWPEQPADQTDAQRA